MIVEKRTSVLIARIAVFAAGVAFLAASNSFAAEYVGSKKCSICHKKEDTGNQYGVWLESKHAKAFEVLGTPEAKEAAAQRGISDPQTSGACLKCHSTAYGFSEARVSEAITVEEGVSCESCHGAGSEYKKKSVMENKDEAIAAGLII